MGKFVILMVGLLLMVASGGCTSSEDASDVYVGTWVSEGGMYAEFHEDGTFSKGLEVSSIESNPWEYGTYSFDGEVLRITTAEASPHCAGIDASYDAEPSEDGTFIAHAVIDDACAGRAADFGKGIQRVP